MTRGKKIAVWSGVGFGALLVVLVLAVAWVLFTTPGARWVAGMVTSRFAPQISYASLDGTIAGRLELRDFRFEGAPDAAKIRIAHLTVDPTLRMLFSRVLRIERANVEGLVVTLPAEPKPDEPDEPLWVGPPLDIVVKDFALRDGVIIKGADRLVSVKQLGLGATWRRDELVIDRLDLLSNDIEGDLSVQGRVVPDARSIRAKLNATWKNVVIPERLAGRVLATNGTLDAEGTPTAYSLSSKGAVGPPGDPTAFTVSLTGTDARAMIRQLTLEQRAGRFAVNGSVDFQPVAWQLKVLANDFDPGALLAGWNGKVNLDLATNGRMEEAGPRGHLEIASLSGVLRDRKSVV